MCWACHERETSRACDGCAELHDLKEYDVFKQWGELAEFVEDQERIVLFCTNCTEEMNEYRDHIRQIFALGIDKIVLPDPRGRDGRTGSIPVGISGDGQVLGFHCAQRKYGVDMVDEVLMGYIYRGDDDDRTIRRLVEGDIDETVRCDKCWQKLYVCNAREVTV
jgi:hypothetical protein